MRLLLDKNFPQKVILDFPQHKLITVEKAGWKGKKNGELLALMMEEGFEGLITLDQNLPNQQNLEKYRIKIFVLKAKNNRPSSVEPLIEKLHSALKNVSTKQVVEIQ